MCDLRTAPYLGGKEISSSCSRSLNTDSSLSYSKSCWEKNKYSDEEREKLETIFFYICAQVQVNWNECSFSAALLCFTFTQNIHVPLLKLVGTNSQALSSYGSRWAVFVITRWFKWLLFWPYFYKSVFWIYKSTFANKQTHVKTIQGQLEASCDLHSFTDICPNHAVGALQSECTTRMPIENLEECSRIRL